MVLQDNLQQLANFIAGKKKELELNIPKISLDRDDELKIRDKVSTMTEGERKRLGKTE